MQSCRRNHRLLQIYHILCISTDCWRIITTYIFYFDFFQLHFVSLLSFKLDLNQCLLISNKQQTCIFLDQNKTSMYEFCVCEYFHANNFLLHTGHNMSMLVKTPKHMRVYKEITLHLPRDHYHGTQLNLLFSLHAHLMQVYKISGSTYISSFCDKNMF